MSRGIAFLTMFPEALRDNAPGTSTLVDVAKVRVVLYRADSSIALDTMVAFPEGQDEVSITMSVPLSPTAPSTGEPLNMGLRYVSTTGDTVFKGAAPVTATAVTGTSEKPTPAAVTVTVTYTGTGSAAKSVVIGESDKSIFIGETFSFSATAFGASANAIVGTPIKWSSLDPDIATITTAGSGVGVGAKRGTARIVAELLTGPKDTVLVTVAAKSSSIDVSSGNNQTGTVGQKLALPIVARTLGTDGLPVGNVPVTVAFGTGTNSATVQLTSDVNGLVTTDWTLGPIAGAQTATMTATGLTGSPLTFTATAQPAAATTLSAGTVQTSVVAGTALSPVTFTARDAFGNVVTSFVGTVTVALGGGSTNVTLAGTKTATAIAGVATFSGLTVTTAATGYTLNATAPNLAAATSSAFAVTPASAASLQFVTAPTSTTADAPIPVFSVNALDPFGNIAVGFTGTVSLALTGTTGTGAALSGTTSVAAIAGNARFDGTRLLKAGTGYQIAVSANGLTPVTSAAFNVTPGVPSGCTVSSAQNQTYFVGQALPIVPTVAVADAAGNAVPSAAVTFTTTGGGTAGSPSTTTLSTGRASSTWTLGTTVGAQTLTATCAGVATPVVFSTNAVALGLKLNAGASSSEHTAALAAGQQITIPIVLDLSFPNGDNIASASFDVLFDATKFSFVSSTVGTFGSVFENTSAAATGKVSVGVFSPTSLVATSTVYTITLAAKSTAATGNTTVGLAVTAAGRENATNVTLSPRDLVVTITP